MRERCPECGSATRNPAPPKFSFPDKYGEYRRQTKRDMDDTESEG